MKFLLFVGFNFYVMSGSICLRNVLLKATTSEETSSGASKVFGEKRDGAIIVDNEDPKEESLSDGQGLPLDLLDKLNIKVNFN